MAEGAGGEGIARWGRVTLAPEPTRSARLAGVLAVCGGRLEPEEAPPCSRVRHETLPVGAGRLLLAAEAGTLVRFTLTEWVARSPLCDPVPHEAERNQAEAYAPDEGFDEEGE